MLAVVDPTAAISWPTLGIAGGAIVSLLLLLGWLIRRQASGAWMTTDEHDKQMARADLDRDKAIAVASEERERAIAAAIADRDRTVAAVTLERDAWKGAHDALEATHAETVRTLGESISANRWLDILIKRRADAPQQGDNVPEGVKA